LKNPGRPPVLVRTDTGFALSLTADERALLAAIPGQLAEALTEVGETGRVPRALRRLFPAAYPTDELAEASYVSLVRADLVEHHRHALAVLSATASATHLAEDELEAWLAALNDLRIFLGESLGVTEEMVEPASDDPRYSEWLCYDYLTYLESLVVDSLAELLPPPAPTGSATPDDPWGDPPGGLRWDGTPVPPDL
jgi:Rad3-related DNA helicase